MVTIRNGNYGEFYGDNGEYKRFIYDNRMECGKDAVLEKLKLLSALQIRFCDFIDDNQLGIRVTLGNDVNSQSYSIKDGMIDFVMVCPNTIKERKIKELAKELKHTYLNHTALNMLCMG